MYNQVIYTILYQRNKIWGEDIRNFVQGEDACYTPPTYESWCFPIHCYFRFTTKNNERNFLALMSFMYVSPPISPWKLWYFWIVLWIGLYAIPSGDRRKFADSLVERASMWVSLKKPIVKKLIPKYWRILWSSYGRLHI